MTDATYDSRLGTSVSEDIDEYVPEDAEPLFGDGDPSNAYVSPMFVTDDRAYNTGVHCRRCYCDVAVTDRETGIVTCPNCGWSSESDDQTWQERAEELHEKGDVAQKQAKVVALLETGKTHRGVKEELGLEDRSEVSTHVRRYREDREEVKWLAEHGPEV